MTVRANYVSLGARAMEILMEQEQYLHQQFSQSETLTPAIWELVKIRVSQINQCAFCIDMHSEEAMKQGETQQRIIGLSAWRDMPHYSGAERIALEWAEHLISGRPTDDECYNQVSDSLGAQAVVDLTVAVNAINSWNRIAKTFKPEVGSYRSGQ